MGFAENHLGAGIPANEAKELGLPARNFMPRSLEEKVIAYADKLTMGGRTTSFADAIRFFKSELGIEHPAIQRLERLHAEIQELMGREKRYS
jgi:uncharacterized protein